jgi:hypothetical protein
MSVKKTDMVCIIQYIIFQSVCLTECFLTIFTKEKDYEKNNGMSVRCIILSRN